MSGGEEGGGEAGDEGVVVFDVVEGVLDEEVKKRRPSERNCSGPRGIFGERRGDGRGKGGGE